MNVAFLTASRADYGKIKPVILEASKNKINYIIFVTGSHLLDEYGKTINQIKKDFKSKKSFHFVTKNLEIVSRKYLQTQLIF